MEEEDRKTSARHNLNEDVGGGGIDANCNFSDLSNRVEKL